MPSVASPTFIVELPLVASLAQDNTMLARLDVARRLYNAALSKSLKRLKLMRDSKAWQDAREMSRGKARNDAFRECNKRFGFNEYAIQSITTQHKNDAGFANRIGAHETQRVASRAFAAAQEYAFGHRGRPRFKGKHRPLHSIEGKSNLAGIRWSKTTATITWGKDCTLPAKLPSIQKDPYLHECLQSTTKYCRILWRMEKGKRRWYAQLIQAGTAPAKYDFHANGQVVGLDIGPSTVAIVADEAVALEQFAPSVIQPWKTIRILQRAQDRSRRATNPQNYEPSGVTKKAPKQWSRSSRYLKRQQQLTEIERRLAETRSKEHGELANRILGLGNMIQMEALSFVGFQKCFGKSAKVRAAGMFVQILKRKAESAGGKVIELNTQKLKMSQYDHLTEVYTKKPLSQRWHLLGSSDIMVQRDCYSAFLAKSVIENQHNPSQLQNGWAAAEPLLRRAGLCIEQSKRGTRLRVPTVAIPSDSIARQRKLVQGHGRDVVAKRREPGDPLQTAIKTPCF